MIPNMKPMSPALKKLIEDAKRAVNAMTPAECEAMYRKQAEGWARSEAQWAKDFREGKCRHD